MEHKLKRGVDVLGAALGLWLLAPCIVALAVAIWWADGTNPWFVQERVGRDGRTFPMIKLRTMVPDAEARLESLRSQNEVSGPAFKMRHDPRVTPLGRVLRRWSLDELPQLWNVLWGDMSLVGPRPALKHEVDAYAGWQRLRLLAPPGMTGLWQVSGRSDIDFERWMALDVQYVMQWSLWLDAWLLWRTVPAVIGGRGAQ